MPNSTSTIGDTPRHPHFPREADLKHLIWTYIHSWKAFKGLAPAHLPSFPAFAQCSWSFSMTVPIAFTKRPRKILLTPYIPCNIIPQKSYTTRLSRQRQHLADILTQKNAAPANHAEDTFFHLHEIPVNVVPNTTSPLPRTSPIQLASEEASYKTPRPQCTAHMLKLLSGEMGWCAQPGGNCSSTRGHSSSWPQG